MCAVLFNNSLRTSRSCYRMRVCVLSKQLGYLLGCYSVNTFGPANIKAAERDSLLGVLDRGAASGIQWMMPFYDSSVIS